MVVPLILNREEHLLRPLANIAAGISIILDVYFSAQCIKIDDNQKNKNNWSKR
jgi:hypothetical protein